MFKWTRPYDFQVVLDRESTDNKFGMTYKQTNENLVVASIEEHTVATSYG